MKCGLCAARPSITINLALIFLFCNKIVNFGQGLFILAAKQHMHAKKLKYCDDKTKLRRSESGVDCGKHEII